MNQGSIDPLMADFLFLSPFQSIAAQGCFRRLVLPVCDEQACDERQQSARFHQAVRDAFAAARAAGIRSPRLCGAIPFDNRQPCWLFIPQYWQQPDRQLVLSQLSTLAGAPPPVAQKRELPAQQAFMRMVDDALLAIRQRQVSKVVLSRLLALQTDQSVSRQQLMPALVAANPDDFCFSLMMDDAWLFGASPELLVRKSGRQFYSAPLAGTARRAASAQEDQQLAQQLLNCAKDHYEHRLVIDAMRQQLQTRSNKLMIPASPALHKTASLWHLCTPVCGEVKESSETALSLACLLHPTPALCGVPMADARDLIRRLEPFDRGMFGGIVGWCDEAGDGEWVVTIRCGQSKGNHVRLFAGAGIVEGSQPLAEWQETAAKLQTLLKHFAVAPA